MACNFSISVSEEELSFSNEGGKETITVSVDGSSTNNSYYIAEGLDYTWFSVERNRNELLIRVDAYYEYDKGNSEEDEDYNPRTGFIRLCHNCDADKTVDISITQRGIAYDVVAETGTLQLTALPEGKEKETIPITVKGGTETFYVKSIKRYDTYNDKQRELDYDYGLICTPLAEKLQIESYGRVFVDEDNYYIITLAHKDYRYKTCEIRVKYDDYPTVTKNLQLSTNKITFDYKGSTDEGDTVEIEITDGNGKTFSDYGYDYEAEKDYDWLTISANPTSLSFDCEANCDNETREAKITVYEYTAGERGDSKIITITQEYNDNCEISLSDSSISIESEEAEVTYETTFRVYGKTKTATINYIGQDWCTITSTSEAYCEYTIYYLYITINEDNTSANSRTLELQITHSDDSSATGTIAITQLGTATIIDGVTFQSIDDNHNILVTVNPTGSQLLLNCTSNWCFASYSDSRSSVISISVSCDENKWDTIRTCKLFVSNANEPTNELSFLITQEEQGTDFSIIPV